MRMIECPECDQKLSTSAANCVSCGHRIRNPIADAIYLAGMITLLGAGVGLWLYAEFPTQNLWIATGGLVLGLLGTLLLPSPFGTKAMSMIQCSECGQKLSQSAASCVSCGRRMRSPAAETISKAGAILFLGIMAVGAWMFFIKLAGWL